MLLLKDKENEAYNNWKFYHSAKRRFLMLMTAMMIAKVIAMMMRNLRSETSMVTRQDLKTLMIITMNMMLTMMIYLMPESFMVMLMMMIMMMRNLMSKSYIVITQDVMALMITTLIMMIMVIRNLKVSWLCQRTIE